MLSAVGSDTAPLRCGAKHSSEQSPQHAVEGGKLASPEMKNKSSSPPAHPFPAAGMFSHPP